MMYLLDTNIFLELLLDQEKANSVKTFFSRVKTSNIFISDFSLHSIGVILFKLKKNNVFIQLVDDMVLNGNVKILSINLKNTLKLSEISKKYSLDFDDAYQYLISDEYDLDIISFDPDFDKTDRKRKLPEKITG